MFISIKSIIFFYFGQALFYYGEKKICTISITEGSRRWRGKVHTAVVADRPAA